ncbi:MAG: glycine cleavage system protein GcvH [Planctomycetes bacterium]|nr:glycine cleavage system protein GcvH [Planctomycetota bacterium]
MSAIPQELLYTENHEWIRVEGDVGTVGITDYAQKALSDITFVDLPKVGAEVAQDDEACAVESCKAAASVYAPVGGKIIEVNAALADDPGRVNADCYGEGWLYKLALADKAELSKLKTAGQYGQLVAKG